MTKEMVLETLQQLPDEFESEELCERLILIDKINKGLKDVDEGRTISIEESKRRMQSKWKSKS